MLGLNIHEHTYICTLLTHILTNNEQQVRVISKIQSLLVYSRAGIHLPINTVICSLFGPQMDKEQTAKLFKKFPLGKSYYCLQKDLFRNAEI